AALHALTDALLLAVLAAVHLGRHRQRRQRAHDDDHLHDGLHGVSSPDSGRRHGAVPVHGDRTRTPLASSGRGACLPRPGRDQRPGATTTPPSFITKETRSVAVMSFKGSSFIPTRSAYAPGSMVPRSFSFPSIVAATTVPERNACHGVIPQAT